MKHQFFRAAALFTALLLTGCTAATQQPAATAQVTPAVTTEATATPQAADADAVPAAGNITMANAGSDEKDSYTDWQSDAYTTVTLSGTSITVDGTGAQIDGSKLTITTAGTYVLSGSLSDGYILVDAPDDADVRIVLKAASIASASGAPLYVKNADKVMISLAPNTENSLADAAEYTYDAYDKDEDEPSAALFSKADLVFNGTGTLTVTAQHNDGIATNDSLKIVEGTFNITAKDDGILGKDFVAVQTAQMTIDAGGDGVKSTNDKDEGKGFIAIAGGKFAIKAGADGLQAETELFIEDGDFNITTGGGSAAAQQKGGQPLQGEMPQNGEMPQGGQPPQGERPQDGEMPQGQPPQGGRGPSDTTDGTSSATKQAEDTSASSGTGLTVTQTAAETTTDGTNSTTAQNAPQGNAAEQGTTDESLSESYKALKAGTFVTIMGGSFNIDAQEDAVHSNAVAIHGGSLTLAAGDDGIHADDSVLIANGLISITSSYEGVEGLRVDITGGEVDIVSTDDGLNIAGGNDSSGGGNDMFAVTQGARFIISGGVVKIDASGDGLDTNGSGYITGGEVYVCGPVNNGNAALDYNGDLEITGGTLVAVGSSGMAQGFSGGTQPSIAGNLDAAQEANATLTLLDSTGRAMLTYKPNKAYQFVAFSSPELKTGETYTIAVKGTTVKEVTLSDTVTTFSLNAAMGGRSGQRQPKEGQQATAQ